MAQKDPVAPLRIAIGLAGLALGGCQINAIDLARKLREGGHSVDLFAVADKPAVSVLPLATKAGFDVDVLPAEHAVLAQARHIRSVVDRSDADVVHVFAEWLAHPAAAALRSRRGRGLVVTNWNMANKRGLPRLPTLIVGTSELQEEAARWHAGPVHLMEPPVDIESDSMNVAQAAQFRRDHDLTSDTLTVVLVSRLDRAMKGEGVRAAISAVEFLDDPSLTLVIVGDGDARRELDAQARQVNDRLGRRAIFLTGAMFDPRPAYGAADIVLAMGGAALRSLAFGKPVVVLGEDGFVKLFEPSATLYFFRHGFFGTGAEEDPVQNLAHLLGSLRDAKQRAELGRFGRRVAQERYSLDLAGRRLEQIYRQAWAESPGWAARWLDLGYTALYAAAAAHVPDAPKQLLKSAARMG